MKLLIESDIDLLRYLKKNPKCSLVYDVDNNNPYVGNADVEVILKDDISALSIMTEMARQIGITFEWF